MIIWKSIPVVVGEPHLYADRPVVALCCGAHFLVCSAEVVFGASRGGWKTNINGDSLAKCVCIYIYTYIHTYIHTCMHTYIHTYIRTYIHTYIHTQCERQNARKQQNLGIVYKTRLWYF